MRLRVFRSRFQQTHRCLGESDWRGLRRAQGWKAARPDRRGWSRRARGHGRIEDRPPGTWSTSSSSLLTGTSIYRPLSRGRAVRGRRGPTLRSPQFGPWLRRLASARDSDLGGCQRSSDPDEPKRGLRLRRSADRDGHAPREAVPGALTFRGKSTCRSFEACWRTSTAASSNGSSSPFLVE